MLWETEEYWDTGHFQNKGAAGGLDLRHPKNTHLCFILFSTLSCLLTHFFLIFYPFCPQIRSTFYTAHIKSNESVHPHCSAESIRYCISVHSFCSCRSIPRCPVCIAYSQLLMTVWAKMRMYPSEVETCSIIIVGCNPVIRIAIHDVMTTCTYQKLVLRFGRTTEYTRTEN